MLFGTKYPSGMILLTRIKAGLISVMPTVNAGDFFMRWYEHPGPPAPDYFNLIGLLIDNTMIWAH